MASRVDVAECSDVEDDSNSDKFVTLFKEEESSEEEQTEESNEEELEESEEEEEEDEEEEEEEEEESENETHVDNERDKEGGHITDEENKTEDTSTQPDLTIRQRTLFVGNVSATTQKKDLVELFKKYGEIEDISIVPVRPPKFASAAKIAALVEMIQPNKQKTKAFVRFVNQEDAETAQEMNGFNFNGCRLQVELLSHDYTLEFKRTVFLGNLPFDIDENTVYDHFESCGPIQHVRLVRYDFTGIGKGVGYVVFKSEDSIEAALGLTGSTLDGHEIRVLRARKNEKLKRNMKLFNPQRARLSEPYHEKPFNSFRGKPFNSFRGRPFNSFRGRPFNSYRGRPFNPHRQTPFNPHRQIPRGNFQRNFGRSYVNAGRDVNADFNDYSAQKRPFISNRANRDGDFDPEVKMQRLILSRAKRSDEEVNMQRLILSKAKGGDVDDEVKKQKLILKRANRDDDNDQEVKKPKLKAKKAKRADTSDQDTKEPKLVLKKTKDKDQNVDAPKINIKKKKKEKKKVTTEVLPPKTKKVKVKKTNPVIGKGIIIDRTKTPQGAKKLKVKKTSIKKIAA